MRVSMFSSFFKKKTDDFTLDRALLQKLQTCRVDVDAPDGNTLLLKNVPTNGDYFNKPASNLLIKRPEDRLPFLVCVDDDLEYLGQNVSLARAFAGAPRQRGWRVLFPGFSAGDAVGDVARDALNILGFDGQVPRLRTPGGMAPRPARRQDALDLYGTHWKVAESLPAIGRAAKVEEVLSCILQRDRRMPVIVGPTGVGKSHLIAAAVRELTLRRRGLPVYSVEAGALMAEAIYEPERGRLLASVLSAAAGRKAIVAFENADQILLRVAQSRFMLAKALDDGARMIGSAFAAHAKGFCRNPLARRVHLIELEEMRPEETLEVLKAHRARLARHHRVEIDEMLLQSVVERSNSLQGCRPGKALALLDAAAVQARLSGEDALRLEDIYLAAHRFREAVSAD